MSERHELHDAVQDQALFMAYLEQRAPITHSFYQEGNQQSEDRLRAIEYQMRYMWAAIAAIEGGDTRKPKASGGFVE